jgi:hypothetical protein
MLCSSTQDGSGSIEFGEFIFIIFSVREGRSQSVFGAMHKKQRDMIEMCNFTPTQLTQLRDEFNSFDHDKSGRFVFWLCLTDFFFSILSLLTIQLILFCRLVLSCLSFGSIDAKEVETVLKHMNEYKGPEQLKSLLAAADKV